MNGYVDFYGICWYNYFWKVFLMWDRLEMPEINMLNEYHLIG